MPTALLNNLTLLSVSPEILSTLLQPQGTNQYAISFTLNPALSPGTSRTLAQVGFTAVDQTNSAIVNLLLPELSALDSDGQIAAKPGAYGGRVFIIGQQPLLDAWLASNDSRILTLYGNLGTNYQLWYSTNLTSTNWQSGWSGMLTNQFQYFPVDPAAPQIFFRAQQ
jgi:hypothetical protein